jgi:hypothetical protein
MSGRQNIGMADFTPCSANRYMILREPCRRCRRRQWRKQCRVQSAKYRVKDKRYSEVTCQPLLENQTGLLLLLPLYDKNDDKDKHENCEKFAIVAQS